MKSHCTDVLTLGIVEQSFFVKILNDFIPSAPRVFQIYLGTMVFDFSIEFCHYVFFIVPSKIRLLLLIATLASYFYFI